MAGATEWHGRIGGLISDKLHVEVSSNDTDLFETGVLDSLAFVELLTLLESEFQMKLELTDLDIDNFRTIGNIANFVLEGSRLYKTARIA
jgi:D-alanine--poly(phosphoribitol) ligase subunit 2